jgi:hypothetical protein
MQVTIKTTEDMIFRQYLTIVNPTLGANKLKPIEIDVLAKLLYIDHLYQHLNKQDRDTILFAQETKKRIRQSLLNMSEASFNNVMLKLRSKKMITRTSLLAKVPFSKDKRSIEISYKLELNDKDSSS